MSDMEAAIVADERGDPGGTCHLGLLLYEQGDLEGAEAAYRRADERGDDAAAYNLGAVLYERGDVEGAGAAYRRAVDSSDQEIAALAREALRTADEKAPGAAASPGIG